MVGLEVYILHSSATYRASSSSLASCATYPLLFLSANISPAWRDARGLTLAVHDPTFDLRALLDDACLPHLRGLALDILAHEARPTRALAMPLDHTLMLQHAALKHLDPDIPSLIALQMLHMPQVKEVPSSPGTTGHPERCYCCVDADALETLVPMHEEALRRLEIASFESIVVFVRAMRVPVLAAHARCRLRTPALACHARAPGAPPIPIRAFVCIALTGVGEGGRVGQGGCGAARAS
ncbi:hypothetical protein EDB83DRAFT_2448082 [Lactarius deliciosus]|nr:hypothetical protein EDB83DRAFT_2448082 [Lactarius deliciosus]